MAIRLGPFDLIAPLGKGGMGVVWQAVHHALQAPVAVKVLTEKIAQEESFLEAFRSEVAAIARLDHPGIVWLYDTGQVSRRAARDSYGQLVEGSPYLAMALADRGTLADLTLSSWAALAPICEQLLTALAHAHAAGVVHRDLKPANVLRSSGPGGSESLWITDFGIAHALDVTQTGAQDGVLGTPSYMAPEQIRAEWREYGPWTDLYALGNLLWRMSTGAAPFQGRSQTELIAAQLQRQPPRFQPQFPVPRGFEAWLRALMAKTPRDRFQRAADALFALRGLGPPPTARSAAGLHLSLDDADDDDEGDLTLTSARPFGASRLGPPRAPPMAGERRATLPVRSHAVLGLGQGLFGVRTLPVVGRSTEQDRLWSTLRTVHAGAAPRVAVVRGDVGAGKSRLLRWWAETADEAGAATVIEVRGQLTGAPDRPLHKALTRWLKAAGLAPDALAQRVGAALHGCGVHEPEIHDLAVELLAPQSACDAESRQEALCTLLRALGRFRPVLLVVDDAQWAMDAVQLALRLVQHEAGRVVVALAVNDEALPDRPVESWLLNELEGSTRVEVIRLAALTESSRDELVSGVFGLSPVLARRVMTRSRGNPLFAVQLVASLVVHDLLLPGPEGLEVVVPTPDATLEAKRAADFPANVEQLWRERLDRILADLPAGAVAHLERAACLGMDVGAAAWREICDDPGGVYATGLQVLFVPEHERVRHALVARLVAERLAEIRSDGWRFLHSPVRELLERHARDAGRLPAHHLACAAYLHRTREGGPEEVGLHLWAAGEVDEAIRLLFDGARARSHAVGDRAAIGLLGHVEDALIACGVAKTDPRWGRVWVERSHFYARLGDADEAVRWARRAEASAVAFGWSEIAGQAAVQAGIAMVVGEFPDAARQEIARGLGLLGEDDPVSIGRARAWLAVASAQCGDMSDAMLQVQEAELRMGEVPDHGLAAAWEAIARAALAEGRRDDAARAFSSAAELFRRLGDRLGARAADAAARASGAAT